MTESKADARWTRRPEGSNWGDFGPDDDVGRLNMISPARRLAAVAEVKDGLCFLLCLPLDFPGGEAPDAAALFEHVFKTLFDGGHARLMAWLLLSGYDPFNETARENWAQIGKVAHGLRLKRAKGARKPAYEDTLFVIALSALALFGQAIAGKATFRVAGLEADPKAERRFRKWLATLLSKHMDS